MNTRGMDDAAFLTSVENVDNYREVYKIAQAEAWRARSEEARLLEENRKQSEQIKALADALELMQRRGFYTDTQTAIDAALRLVGRLP